MVAIPQLSVTIFIQIKNMEVFKSIVEVKHLVKKYSSFTLNDVSFGIEAGRITGFIGRNGAGKTTTIKSMLNLIHPDNGEVYYFGKPLAGNEKKIKKRIGKQSAAGGMEGLM